VKTKDLGQNDSKHSLNLINIGLITTVILYSTKGLIRACGFD